MASRYPLFTRSRLRLRPLTERDHDIQVDPALGLEDAPALTHPDLPAVAERVRAVRQRGAAPILMAGVHLIRQRASRQIIDLIRLGVLTHVATNGAGVIHDYELALSRRAD